VRPEVGRTSIPSAKGSVWALGGRPGALSADYYRDFTPDAAAANAARKAGSPHPPE
jgi:8-oxo-(d)GTP phosphatase